MRGYTYGAGRDKSVPHPRSSPYGWFKGTFKFKAHVFGMWYFTNGVSGETWLSLWVYCQMIRQHIKGSISYSSIVVSNGVGLEG